MERTFHHHFTLSAKCGIALLAMLTFYLFWEKMVVVGLVVVVALVVMMERVIHTSYTFTEDKLFINKGRFSKKQEILLNEIIHCIPMSSLFGISHYLLLEFGAGHLASVQPEDEDSFQKELKERQATL